MKDSITVGYEFDRAAEKDAQADHGHVFVIDMQLHAEGAADIRRDDPNLGFGDAVMAGIEVLELIRRLGRVMDGETMLRRIVIGDDGARLQRHRRMPAKVELLLDNMRGARQKYRRCRRYRACCESKCYR